MARPGVVGFHMTPLRQYSRPALCGRLGRSRQTSSTPVRKARSTGLGTTARAGRHTRHSLAMAVIRQSMRSGVPAGKRSLCYGTGPTVSEPAHKPGVRWQWLERAWTDTHGGRVKRWMCRRRTFTRTCNTSLLHRQRQITDTKQTYHREFLERLGRSRRELRTTNCWKLVTVTILLLQPRRTRADGNVYYRTYAADGSGERHRVDTTRRKPTPTPEIPGAHPEQGQGRGNVAPALACLLSLK